MIALIYFMKLFDIEYFNKISQKCVGNKSVLQLLKNSSPLYLRVMVVPIVAASLCVCIASYMPHWILMGIFSHRSLRIYSIILRRHFHYQCIHLLAYL